MIQPWLLAVVDATVLVGLVVFALRAARQTRSHGTPLFALVLLTLAGLAAVDGLAWLELVPPRWKLIGVVIGWPLAVTGWFGFAIEYAGRRTVRTPRRLLALFSIPLLVLVTYTGAPAVGEMLRPVFVLSRVLLSLVTFSLGLFGLLLVVQTTGEQDVQPRQRLALATVGGGVSILALPIFLRPVAIRFSEQSVVLTAFLVLIGSSVIVACRYSTLFDDGPTKGRLARQTVFEGMEPVVVVDRGERVVDTNETAEETFGIDSRRDHGDPVEAVLGRSLDDAGDAPVTLQTQVGRREFAVRDSELSNSQDERVGRAYLLWDVTERQTEEQRLTVLNRVLRHNLRNDLDAIRAFAEVLAEDGSGADAEHVARRIRGLSTELVEMGETAATAERLLSRQSLAVESVNAVALAESVTDAVRQQRPDGDFSVIAPTEAVTVETNRDLLRVAVRAAVENAVEHSDAAEPRVEVRVEPTDDGVAISVADDGPGIPEGERAVLLDGDEEPLRHGSGLGLWVIHWSVRRLGGHLSFSENDPRGSVVELAAPNRSEAADE